MGCALTPSPRALSTSEPREVFILHHGARLIALRTHGLQLLLVAFPPVQGFPSKLRLLSL